MGNGYTPSVQLQGDTFIWTEALGCAEILTPMLSSFVAHHSYNIHVFIYEDELDKLPTHKQIIPVLIGDSKEKFSKNYFIEGYKQGHLGTARLWSYILKTQREEYFVHLDSDTIFLNDIVSDLLFRIRHYGVVGSRRPYRFATGKRRFRAIQFYLKPDAVNTHCFAFRNSFKNYSIDKLIQMISARHSNFISRVLFPFIDFFDPITFALRKKYGIYYLDSENQGKHGYYSRYGPFEQKIISFSAVGSGYSFFHGYSKATSKSYEEFAIASFSLYSKHLLGRDIGIEPLKSEYLEGLLMKLDVNTWLLKS